MKTLSIAILGLLALTVPLTAQEGIDYPPGVDDSTISAGETLYKSIALCFACHGPTGGGVPGAGVDLTDSEWLHNDGSFAGILEQILSGVGPGQTKSGIIMVPRGGSQITDDQALAVASYVWSLSRGGSVDPR